MQTNRNIKIKWQSNTKHSTSTSNELRPVNEAIKEEEKNNQVI